MAHTVITDVFDPKTFADAVAEKVSTTSALIQSGALIRSDQLNSLANSAGRVIEIPTFSEFVWSAPDIAKDDSTAITVNNVGTKPQLTQKDFLSKSWGTSALAMSVSGEDIMAHIVNNVVAPYWVKTLNELAIAKLTGVLADNSANDSGDMIRNVATDAVGNPAAAESANLGNIADAVQTLGDARDSVNTIAMHSQVFTNLFKLEANNFVPASATQPFTTYNGMKVIIDDALPVTQGTNRKTYSTYIFGQMFAYGEGTPDMGEAVIKEDQNLGNGWGQQALITRKQLILHPLGTASSATVSAGFASPTMSAYNAASAWNRIYSRKNIPLVCLRTNA